jgi:hypothetical protein
MSKRSGRGHPPKEFQFKKGVSGNLKGRPPKNRKDQLVIDIIGEFRNILTAYREGGRAKRASRLELLLKKLVNSALEGDARSAEALFKLRAKASKTSGAKSQKFIVENWVPDFPGQTGEQKTRAHAREKEFEPTGSWEQTGPSTTDPPGSVSASPKPPPDP